MKYIKTFNENFSDEFTYENEEGEITYRVPQKSEISLYSGVAKNPVILDRIDVQEKSSGFGTRLMKEFITKMKSDGVDLIYLYATYDTEDYEDESQNDVDGHKRLISFYKKLGFEELGSVDEYGEHIQVDMYLEL